MSAERLNASPALLALLRSKPIRDPATLRGYETGEIATQPANRRSKSQGLPFLQHGPYGTGRRYLDENNRATRHERRRMRGGDGRLPHSIRHQYTEGQRAALSVVGQEVAKSGRCELAIQRIATLAGVAIRTVQYALRRAATLGHLAIVERPQRGRKSLTNVIRIAVKEWATWLKPKRSAAQGIGCKDVHTTEIKKDRTSGNASTKPTEEAYEGEQAAKTARHRRVRRE